MKAPAPRLDETAAKLLEREDVGMKPPSPAQRERAVAAIEAALVARTRARARRRVLVPLVLAAATVLVAGGAYRRATYRPPPPSTVAAHTAPPPVTAPAPPPAPFVAPEDPSVAALGADGRVTTNAAHATFRLRTGTSIAVSPRSDVVLPSDEREQIVVVREGAVTSRVAKLAGGTRYLVRTSNAEVEVRGTVFTVGVSERTGCGRETVVDVEEGRVVVRSSGAETVLERGGHWSTPCPSVVASAASPVIHRAPPPASGPPVPATVSASDLPAQNALLADAMAARRRGENQAALGTLDRLIAQYPQSPLREAAEVQRMKVLADIDDARAQAAARAYLAAYPSGFARREAETILGP